MKHEALFQKADQAIRDLHGDTSVSQSKTLESLRDLRATISIMIETLEHEVKEDDEG